MPRRLRKRRRPPDPLVSPETRREIIMIFLFTAAGLAALAYFGLAGKAGTFIDGALALFLGTLRPLLPLALIAAGATLGSKEPRGAALFGLTLLIISSAALTHIFSFPGQLGVAAVRQGLGGGYAGLFLAYPLHQIFGLWAAVFILAALAAISLSLIFSAPLSAALRFLRQALAFFLRAAASLPRALTRTKIHGDYSAAPAAHPEFQTLKLERAEGEPTRQRAEAPEKTPAPEQKTGASAPEEVAPRQRQRVLHGPIEIPLDLLEVNGAKPVAGDIRARQEAIQKTFKNFGIDVEMGDVSVGPTVTQYTLRPSQGVKLSSITALSNDLALALAAHPIRIEAPIPGRSLVGIEVPNEQASTVRLREVLEAAEWKKRVSPLTVAVGRDVSGKPYLADLSRMPHLLVAGSTGTGKTVCLNSIILSLLYQNGPDDLKFVLIDPKRVELPSYNGIPHLLASVITDVKQTVQSLRWCIGEMERRFEALAAAEKRDIRAFNENRADGERMPYLIIIVDELADLMAAAASEVEASVIRLAQMARAVGIHLILATQRPSVDVITGLIKANITARIAFAVAALIDSRTILDSAGAEKLLGRGDMLYVAAELSKPKRLQGVYVSDQEIKRVVDFLKKAGGQTDYLEITAPSKIAAEAGENFSDEESDPLLAETKTVILQAGKASASLLQRRLKVGYARAARILDLLEAEGFIGPADGAKPREILAPTPRNDQS